MVSSLYFCIFIYLLKNFKNFSLNFEQINGDLDDENHIIFLNSIIKLFGIEFNYDYLEISPIFKNNFFLETSLFSIKYEANKIYIKLNFLSDTKIKLKIKIPSFWKNMDVLINGKNIDYNKTNDNFILINYLKKK